MDLASIETNVKSWVETTSGLSMRWRHQPQIAMTFPRIEGELLVIRGKGVDEPVWSYDSDTDSNDLTMSGVRAFTITLHFQSRSQNLGESARYYVERFRTRTLRPGSITTLTAANLALSGVLGVNAGDFEDRNGRALSQVSVDLAFEARSSEADTTWDGSYIKKVTVTTDKYVTDEYGNPITDENGDHVVTDTGYTMTIEDTDDFGI